MLLCAASLGLVLGVFSAMRWEAGLASSFLFVIVLLALALLLRLRGVRIAAVAIVGIACLFLGLARASCSPVQPVTTVQLQALEGTEVTLRGAVVGDPERVGNAYRLRVRGDLILSSKQEPPLSGDILVTVRPWRELIECREDGAPRYGDVLRIQGKLAALEPFGGFDYRSYLAEQGLFGAMCTPQASLLDEGRDSPFLIALFAVRKSSARSLERSLPEPQSAAAQALLLGLRRELPADVNSSFFATGAIHILAISGQHMTILPAILLGLAYGMAGRKRWGLLAALAVLWLYTGLAGASPPVVRVAIMGTLAVWARHEGRPSTGTLALAVAAAAMVAVTPSVLFSVSFQLSVASMAGLVLLAPALNAWMKRRVQPLRAEGNPLRPLVRGTILALAAGTAATLFTLPMAAFYFHRLSLIGVPLTLVLLPVFPLMLVTSAAAAIAGVVWGPLGQVIGWTAWLPLTYMLKVVQTAAIPSHVSLNLASFAAIVALGYYAMLIAATVRFSRPHRPAEQRALDAASAHRETPNRAWPRLPEWTFIPSGLWDRLPKKTVAIGLLGAGLFLWVAALSAPSGNLLRVAILDVGQESAALVMTPSGHQALVYGGPEPGAVLRGLGQRLPF
ncbi:MAG: ComEC family competence protein [Dehalococcoidia bacterium]|nr:ComEC family competence protein [Dehalococcoidia bacterium]